MKIMGIDIGTTTVSVVMTDTETGKLLARETVEHNSFLRSSKPEQKLQDPERIYEIVRELLIKQQKENGLPDGIGFTGQMHGMLYVDASGKAVSPLYTWQDGSGEIPLENGKTCAELLQGVGAAASGYGVVTHFYLQKKDQIPKDAVRMTTISDYIAMRLCENLSLLSDLTWRQAGAALTCENRSFCMKPWSRPRRYFLSAGSKKGTFFYGETRAGVPVMGSIGDNQASLFGSVRNLKDTVLLNVGTGSQVSLVTEKFIECSGSVELRPCTENSYILVGASLCGGRAYAMLEQFYRETAETEERLYSRMQEQAEKFIETYGKEAAWKVDTAFSGTRSDPSHRGMIAGIGVENFHPGALTVGVICGILNELHEQYEQMCQLTGKKATRLTGSGNGIRRNSLMRRLAEEMFKMPMEIPEYEEEVHMELHLLRESWLRQCKKNFV